MGTCVSVQSTNVEAFQGDGRRRRLRFRNRGRCRVCLETDDLPALCNRRIHNHAPVYRVINEKRTKRHQLHGMKAVFGTAKAAVQCAAPRPLRSRTRLFANAGGHDAAAQAPTSRAARERDAVCPSSANDARRRKSPAASVAVRKTSCNEASAKLYHPLARVRSCRSRRLDAVALNVARSSSVDLCITGLRTFQSAMWRKLALAHSET